MSSGKSKKYMQQGLQYQRSGNFSAALKSYEKASIADAKNIDAWLTLGNIYFQQKQLPAAEKCYIHIVNIKPFHIEVLNKLGILYFHTRQHAKAINCYQKILKKQPDNAAVHFNVAISFIEDGHRLKAVEHVKKSLALSPNNIEAHNLLASSLTILADFEGAKLSYQNASKLNPNNLDAIGGEAFSRVKLGDHQGAYELVSKFVKSNCNNMSIAMAYAMTLKVHNDLAGAIGFLENVIKHSQQDNKQKAQMHFEVGALYDKDKQFDKAFEHYKKANSLIRVNYNKERDSQFFENIISVFSAEKINQFKSVQQSDIRPIFIVGMPRSGTSLVEQILSCHSDVVALGETAELQDMIQAICGELKTDLVYPQIFDDIDFNIIQKMADNILTQFSGNDKSAKLITNKLPHNFLFLGLINCLFPNAKIIHCTRNPIDTCLSNYFQLFSGPLDYAYDLDHIAHHFIGYKKLMAHWNSALSIPILELNYEALIGEQEKYSRKLIEYCELDWQEACLHFYNSKRVTQTASNEQVRQKIHNNSVARWKNYSKYIGPLDALK